MMDNLIAYIISIAASMTWDGFKNAFFKKTDCNPERQLMLALANTMKEFYCYMDFEYDEDIVMENFISAVRKYKDLKWHFRNIIEYTIGQSITDEQFECWVELYAHKASWSERPFIGRDQTLDRIKLKLPINDFCSYGNLDPIINRMIDAFNVSWKQKVINLLSSLGLDLSFAQKPEKCDVILSYFKHLKFDISQFNDVKTFYEYLYHPHFNKVQLVSGTSGAGKTHFVKAYIKKAIRQFPDIPIPCFVNISSLQSLQTDILESLHQFIEIDCKTLEEYYCLLDALSIKITFVIENINVLLNDDWVKVVDAIKEFTRYDSFNFIITINEYEYYEVEKDPVFLERYCIETLEMSFFKYCLSIDEFNVRQNVIGKILRTEFEIKSDFKFRLTTPQEAIYYGECIRGEREVSPPSSYYEYIVKIVQWKEKQVDLVLLNRILKDIIEQKSSVVKTERNVTTLRHAQLLTPEKHSLFASIPVYHLRIYPYWAAKIVGYDTDGLLNYSDDLKEWLVSCYIFYKYHEDESGIDNLDLFFENLTEKGFLDYAVFCAPKADIRYMKELYRFLVSTDISNPRLCYAVLRNYR